VASPSSVSQGEKGSEKTDPRPLAVRDRIWIKRWRARDAQRGSLYLLSDKTLRTLPVPQRERRLGASQKNAYRLGRNSLVVQFAVPAAGLARPR
jgi:hypothetical protein